VAVAVRSRVVDGPAEVIAVRPVDEPGLVGRDLDVDVRAGHPKTVEKIASLYPSRDSAVSEPATAALEQLRNAPGFRALLDPHRRAWDSLWRQFDISVDDPDGVTPPDLFTDVRIGSSMSCRRCPRTSSTSTSGAGARAARRGLPGPRLPGRAVPDARAVGVLAPPREGAARVPVPPAAGGASGGGGDRLPRGDVPLAVRQRRPGGEPAAAPQPPLGALASGRDEPAASLGAAVALTPWRLYEATGDHQLLVDRVAELVLDAALFFSSLTTYDPAKHRYMLRGMVGPDEFHTGYPGRPGPGIDDNAYTNLLVVWLLRTALRVLDTLTPTQAETVVRRVGVTTEDRRRWQSFATRMFVPFRDGLLLQLEGYDRLAELAWDDYRERTCHGSEP
jgi:alpha,alpha-trehalase